MIARRIRHCRLLHAARVFALGVVLALCVALLASPGAQAAPSLVAAPQIAAAMPFWLVRGICSEPCPDCTDCIPEIDIAPGPYREREDPIGHAIKRYVPSPPPEDCEDDHTSERRGDPFPTNDCGIRCWYWRLRYGYCGPGCDYYRFRMSPHYGEPGPRHPRSACRS